MFPTIAFHGDFARPEHLQEDAGDPPWVDLYETYDDTNGYRNIATAGLVKRLKRFEKVILVGYSRGGDLIAWLSHQLQNIVAAVLYESPVLSARPTGRFPVMMCWNEESIRKPKWWQLLKNKRYEIAQNSINLWGHNRNSAELHGRGGHIKRVDRPPLNRGHGWDVGLNQRIGNWIREQRLRVRVAKLEERHGVKNG